MSPDIIWYEVTIEDPNVFTRHRDLPQIMNPPAPMSGKMMAEDERELAKSAA
jgi:hypothetical protein